MVRSGLALSLTLLAGIFGCNALPHESEALLEQLSTDKHSLCATLVGSHGCDGDILPFGISRLVRDVCSTECAGRVDTSGGSTQLHRRLHHVADHPACKIVATDCGWTNTTGSNAFPKPFDDDDFRQQNPWVATGFKEVEIRLSEAEVECIWGEGADAAGIGGACLNPAEPLPLWFAVLTTVLLTCCSGFCSGLTLGLMGLDMTMLQVIIQSGSPQQQKQALTLQPIRKTGNRLLCVLLIGNTAVNAGLAITMASFSSGFTGFLLSTVLILVWGEITPQAICSRHGLTIGYYLFWPLQLVCWAAFPLAFPIAKALDAVLGKEIGLSYSRDELIALLSLHSVGGRTKRGPQGDLHDQEAKILQGVLKFSTKIANDVVTPLEYVQAISMDDVLDLKLMGKLYRSGHSRIPVYKGEKENLMGVIFIKDLIIVDPADNVPVTKVVEYFKHPLPIVSKDLGLLTLLDDFVEGHAHMAAVVPDGIEENYDIATGEKSDNPLAHNSKTRGGALGIVTLEDLFEEMIMMEITDEHDKYLDNKEGRINERSKLHIHEAPPSWLTHYELPDEIGPTTPPQSTKPSEDEHGDGDKSPEAED